MRESAAGAGIEKRLRSRGSSRARRGRQHATGRHVPGCLRRFPWTSRAPCGSSGVYNDAPGPSTTAFPQVEHRRDLAPPSDVPQCSSRLGRRVRPDDLRHPHCPVTPGGSVARLRFTSSAALITILAVPAFNRSTAALTSADAIDSLNVHANVGVIMVWRDANNPLGLPGGLATYVTGVLIHPQTILTAGHFTARVEGASAAGQLPPWNRIVASFAPNAFDQSTWTDLNRALGTCVAHPSFPRPCTPQSCPFNDIDGQHEPGVS